MSTETERIVTAYQARRQKARERYADALSGRRYDSEAMASDIADATGDMWGVEIGELFSRGNDSHAFNIVTPSGRKFLVTVTEVEAD